MRAKSWDIAKTSIFEKAAKRAATPGQVALKLRDLRAERQSFRVTENATRGEDEQHPRLTVPRLVKEAELPCSPSFLYKLLRGKVGPWTKGPPGGPWAPQNRMRLASTIARLAVFFDTTVEEIMECPA